MWYGTRSWDSILILQQSEDFSGPIRGGSALACYWGLKVFICHTCALTWLGNQDLSAELGLSHSVGEDVMCSECNGALGTSDTSVLYLQDSRKEKCWFGERNKRLGLLH